MARLAKHFRFDEDDLYANQRHRLSQRQMRSKQNQIDYGGRESFFKRYEYMFGVFAVGSLFVAGLVFYTELNNLRWLSAVILFVVIVAVVVSLIMALIDDEQPTTQRKAKQKRAFHAVQRIQGRVHLFTSKDKNGNNIYQVRVHDDRTFIVTRDQYDCLDTGAEYIFYYANGRILSVEQVEDESMSLLEADASMESLMAQQHKAL